MEDRKASLVAAALGSVCIGGFWLVRPVKGPAPLSVVERVAVAHGYGQDGDAALVFRVKKPPSLREAELDGVPILYRVVDHQGRIYPVLPMLDPHAFGSLKLLRGYASRPENARLEALSGDAVLASCPLDDLPAAEDLGLVASPDAPVRLVYQGNPGLCVFPRVAIPRGERWRVTACRTRFSDKVDALAEIPTRNPISLYARLNVPYPEESKAVEIDIERYRFTPETVVVRIPNLRLLRRFGGVALVADRAADIQNSLGANIRVPKQYMGPRHLVRRPDGVRTVSAMLVAAPPWAGNGGAPPFRRERGPDVEILSPSPESLGLDELRLGPTIRRASQPPRVAVKEGPFTLVARITFRRPTVVGRIRTVAEVVVAPRPWPAPPPDRIFGMAGPQGR